MILLQIMGNCCETNLERDLEGTSHRLFFVKRKSSLKLSLNIKEEPAQEVNERDTTRINSRASFEVVMFPSLKENKENLRKVSLQNIAKYKKNSIISNTLSCDSTASVKSILKKGSDTNSQRWKTVIYEESEEIIEDPRANFLKKVSSRIHFD